MRPTSFVFLVWAKEMITGVCLFILQYTKQGFRDQSGRFVGYNFTTVFGYKTSRPNMMEGFCTGESHIRVKSFFALSVIRRDLPVQVK